MITLFDKNIVKIMTVFSVSPGSRINRKTIQEKTKINNIILDKTLNLLLNSDILIQNKKFFSLNFKNNETKKILEIISEYYNKCKQLPFNAYFMVLDTINEIIKVRNIGDVYLFGSYSKLIFKESSDVDFAIISDNVNKKEVNRIILKLEKKFNKRIEIHYFTREFYNNKRDALVKEILKDGIRLI